MQARPRNALDARQRNGLDRPELGEVDGWDRRQRAPAARNPGWASERRLDILACNAPLLACAPDQVQIEAKFARQNMKSIDELLKTR